MTTSTSPNLIRIAKWLIYLLVITGVFYSLWKGITQINESELSFSKFRWQWLPVASFSYFLNMVICWLYWHRVLQVLDQQPAYRDSFRAFVLGQLGKYFPGKALVVLVRTSLVASPRVSPAVAATSVFLETLTYMAVGAGMASLIMIFLVDVGPWLIALGILAIALAGLPILPPVFRFLIRILRIDRLSPKIGKAVARLDRRISLEGWMLFPFAWILVGTSLWSTIQLIGVGEVSITEIPRLTACAGLAIVAGFLSLMPGGLGVREFVLIAILSPLDPAFDASSTLIIAVVLRLVWLVTEALLTIILKGLGWLLNWPLPSATPDSLPPSSGDDKSLPSDSDNE